MKRFSFLLSLLLVGAGILYAQDGPRKHAKEKVHQAHKAFLTEQVYPVMVPLREQLDVRLNSVDQQELEQIRQGMAELKESSKSLQQMRKERRSLMNRAHDLADRYEADIDQLLNSVADEVEAWRTALHDLHDDHRPRPDARPNREGRSERHAHAGRRHRGHVGMRRGHHGLRMLRPVGFLLWDTDQVSSSSPAPIVNLFPNPTQGLHTLNYTVSTPGPVSIRIINEQAQVLKTLLDAEQEAGMFKLEVNLSEWEPGLYFYQIKTVEGLRTEKLLIERP